MWCFSFNFSAGRLWSASTLRQKQQWNSCQLECINRTKWKRYSVQDICVRMKHFLCSALNGKHKFWVRDETLYFPHNTLQCNAAVGGDFYLSIYLTTDTFWKFQQHYVSYGDALGNRLGRWANLTFPWGSLPNRRFYPYLACLLRNSCQMCEVWHWSYFIFVTEITLFGQTPLAMYFKLLLQDFNRILITL